MREITSAPQEACGLGAPASAARRPSGPYKRAARVVVPMSTAAPQRRKAGARGKSGMLPPVRIWSPPRAPGRSTRQSPITSVRQARRSPWASSSRVRCACSSGEGGLTCPCTRTRHFPQRPAPAHGVSTAPRGKTWLSRVPGCTSRLSPFQITCAKAFHSFAAGPVYSQKRSAPK